MKKIINWAKNIRLSKVLTVFLSGLLLFVSTACGSSNVLAKTADQVREEVPSGAVTSPYEGGMNQYSEVDPRKNTTRTDAKAKALVDRSEANIRTKGVDSAEDYAENYREGTSLGERVRRIGEDVGTSTKELTEGVTKGTQKGVQNVKANTQDAVEDAPSAVKAKVKSDINNTKEAVGKAADAID